MLDTFNEENQDEQPPVSFEKNEPNEKHVSYVDTPESVKEDVMKDIMENK